jgi:uncharacterized protein DUF4178
VELVILAIVAGLSFASYAIWKQARGIPDDPGQKPPLGGRGPLAALSDGERTIHTMQPGDVVSHLDADYIVEGVLTLNDDGRVTRLYRLVDGSRERWLGARPGDESPLLLAEAADLTVEANGPESITHRGLPFRLAKRESAQCAAAGAVGPEREGGRAQLYEYVGAGAARIVALVWPGRVDAFAGERVARHVVEILPGAAEGGRA